MKQMELIGKLMEQKGYTVSDIMNDGFSSLEALTGGKGGTASDLIDYLIKAISKIVNGQPANKFDDEVPPMATKTSGP